VSERALPPVGQPDRHAQTDQREEREQQSKQTDRTSQMKSAGRECLGADVGQPHVEVGGHRRRDIGGEGLQSGHEHRADVGKAKQYLLRTWLRERLMYLADRRLHDRRERRAAYQGCCDSFDGRSQCYQILVPLDQLVADCDANQI
jgi:hypothetical protein